MKEMHQRFPSQPGTASTACLRCVCRRLGAHQRHAVHVAEQGGGQGARGLGVEPHGALPHRGVSIRPAGGECAVRQRQHACRAHERRLEAVPCKLLAARL